MKSEIDFFEMKKCCRKMTNLASTRLCLWLLIQVQENKDKNTSMYNVKRRRKIVPEKFSYI